VNRPKRAEKRAQLRKKKLAKKEPALSLAHMRKRDYESVVEQGEVPKGRSGWLAETKSVCARKKKTIAI